MIVTGKVPLSKAIYEQWQALAIVLGVSVLVTLARYVISQKWIALQWIAIPFTPLTALGVALGVFLSLRSNVVYNRYWEARTLLGRLVNASRTFPRQLATFLTGGTEEERDALYREFCLRHLAFVRAFRAHLRDEDTRADIGHYLTPGEMADLREVVNVPSALLHRQGQELHKAFRRGMITEFHMPPVDESLTEFASILGGCEKIKNTPLPPAYTFLAHRIMLIYCCLLPFALVDEIGILTPLLTVVISFAFLTLDRTSDLIEVPFATEDNDLPLNTIARNIEIELLQRIGERDLPPKLEPVDGILL
ncbi:MAG: bestrophin family ion channel [Armatimonadaceae bacterium]